MIFSKVPTEEMVFFKFLALSYSVSSHLSPLLSSYYITYNIFVRKDEVSYITYLNLGWEVIYLCKEIYVFHIMVVILGEI